MPNDTVLSDEKLIDLELRPAHFSRIDNRHEVGVTPEERDALCATVRALRVERLEIQRVLASAVLEDPTEDDDPLYSTTELVEGVRWLLRMKEMKQERVTALHEQLAEVKDELRVADDALDNQVTLISELRVQLAQVTQERDELRDELRLKQVVDEMTDRSLKPEIREAMEKAKQ